MRVASPACILHTSVPRRAAAYSSYSKHCAARRYRCTSRFFSTKSANKWRRPNGSRHPTYLSWDTKRRWRVLFSCAKFPPILKKRYLSTNSPATSSATASVCGKSERKRKRCLKPVPTQGRRDGDLCESLDGARALRRGGLGSSTWKECFPFFFSFG